MTHSASAPFQPSGGRFPLRITPPLYFRSASGSQTVDADENTYLAFTLSQGPMFLGHSPPEVLGFVTRALRDGQLYGAQHELEIELAEQFQRNMPCAELLRFCNSGSEAVHAAVRVARAATGRAKILRFEGHYHGWYDEALARAMLGYNPQYSFDKMVDSALAHQRGEAIDQIPN